MSDAVGKACIVLNLKLSSKVSHRMFIDSEFICGNVASSISLLYLLCLEACVCIFSAYAAFVYSVRVCAFLKLIVRCLQGL